MNSTNHAASVCSTRGEMQSQANPSQTRTGSVGRPSGMVPGGAQTPRSKTADEMRNPRIGSDAETADLVAALLATGYAPSALCVALTIDEDTLRRWRRGIQASHGMRKLMRCVLALRRLAPGLLAVVSMGNVGDLVAQLDGLTVRHLTAADVQREAITAEMKRMTWRDGAEGGGL